MSNDFPKLCAVNGHGFNHEIVEADGADGPHPALAYVATSPEGWRLAQLFAAAPDLLAAVEPIASVSLDNMQHQHLAQLTKRIRAAITKAQGTR